MTTLYQTDQPVNTVVGTGSYTVPTGKWANIYLNMYCYIPSGSYDVFPLFEFYNRNTIEIKFNLKSGDVLTFTNATSNGSQPHGFTYVRALVNSSIIAESRAYSWQDYATGSFNIYYLSSEYNNTI